MKKNITYYIQEYGVLIALAILVLATSIYSKEFRSIDNLFSLLRQSSVNAFISFGMAAIILTGGIDLSVGSVLALTTAIAASLIKAGFPVLAAIIIALILGACFGAINGIMVTKGKLQPFIATLITMTVYRGLTYIYTSGMPISNLGSDEHLQLLDFIGKGKLGIIPFPVILLVIVFVIFYIILNNTKLGRSIYAVGSNDNCAELAGIKTARVKMFVYTISGVMATLAGMIILSRLSSAQPVLGKGYELDAIAAVALGGTSMAGGRGKISNTLIGVLIIAVLNNGMNIINVSSYFQDVVKGLVILIAVLADKKK